MVEEVHGISNHRALGNHFFKEADMMDAAEENDD